MVLHEADDPQCDQFRPQIFESYANCTASGFVSGWTEHCCQPKNVRGIRVGMLFVIGTVTLMGIIVNIFSIFTLLYLTTCRDRIRRKFGQDLSFKPVFLLTLHLSICDLLYCLIGLPNFWDVYYYGYYPYSHEMCKLATFARFSIAYADFATLALISLQLCGTTFGFNSCFPSTNHALWAASRIAIIWIYSIGVNLLSLLGGWGQFGYDAVNGKCNFMPDRRTRYDLILSLLGIAIPGVIIISSYTIVFIRVWRVQANEVKHNGSTSSRNLNKTLVTLSVSYSIFILPIWIIKLFDHEALATALVFSVYYPTYVINFFIYIGLWKTFQLAARNLVTDVKETVFGITKKPAEEIQLSSVTKSDIRAVKRGITGGRKYLTEVSVTRSSGSLGYDNKTVVHADI